MIKKTILKRKVAVKNIMNQTKKPDKQKVIKLIKADDLCIGDKIESGVIIGVSKGAGTHYFLVKENNKYTILRLGSKCRTYPTTARNIPEKNMNELFCCFKMFTENK